MAIEVSCVCGKKYAVTDDKAGKKLRCAGCQSIMDIPGKPSGSTPAMIPSSVSAPPPPMAAPVVVPPPVAAGPRWFYTQGGQPVGPIAESSLAALIRSGGISLNEYGWKEGDTNSRTLSSIPEFSAHPFPGASGGPNSPAPAKRKWTALLWGIFAGTGGAHRFYLGYNGLGACMLALALLSIPTGGLTGAIVLVWNIVDVVSIARNSLKDANGNPLV